MTKPTIADLEALLNSEDDTPVEVLSDGSIRTIPWPDPTPEMLTDPKFESVWQTIKSWDIGVPSAYRGYCGATGNHVRAILDALATVS